MPSSIPGPETIHRHVLPNGIVVLTYENDASPSVALHGYLWAGALDEPEELGGLGAFTAEMLSRGAGKRTMAEIYHEVESIGASMGVEGDRYLTGFGAKSLAEDAGFVLGLLADVLRRPKFPADEIEHVRQEFLTDIEIRAHDTRAMADKTFRELAYPGHPYSRSTDGTLETIRRIQRKDIMRFHRTYYAPAAMTFVFAGALTAEQAVQRVGETFGDWQAERPARPPVPPPPPITQTVSRHVTLAGKTQTDVILGVHGPARSAPDYMAARMANNVLGVFGMMGRLGNNVRDTQGLAYYSLSRLEGGLGPGPWAAIAGVNPANVERAVVSMRDEIRRLLDEPVGAEELAENKSYATGSMPLALETNDSLAQNILNLELYGLGLDYLLHYHELVDALTAADLQAAARRYLNPDCYVLATAGPAQGG
jgi:zinc protease